MRSLVAFLLLALTVSCGAETSEPTPNAPATNPPASSNEKKEEAPPSPPATNEPAPITPEPGPVLTIEGTGDMKACVDKELDIPATGLSIVTHVNTTSMQRAHFWAIAKALTPESPASITLEVAENGTKIKDGWDVCVGQSNPGCHANLEMSPGIAKRTFTVTVRPKASTATRANVSICVIDPLE